MSARVGVGMGSTAISQMNRCGIYLVVPAAVSHQILISLNVTDRALFTTVKLESRRHSNVPCYANQLIT